MTGKALGAVGFTDTVIASNLAHFGGGGVYLLDLDSLTLDGLQVHDNEAEYAEGGAFFIRDVSGAIEIDEVDFVDNTSELEGGALFTDDFVSLEVTGGSFEGNTTEQHVFGGAMFSHGTLGVSTLAVDGTHFVDNFIPAFGSAMANHTLDSVTITDAEFRENATRGSSYMAGAVYNRFVRAIEVDGTEFVDNGVGAGLFGPGGLYNVNFESLVVRDSLFLGQESTGDAAIWNCNDSDPDWTDADCNEPTYNFDAEPGASFHASVVIEDSTFDGNRSTIWGAAALKDNYIDTLQIRGSVFRDNHSAWEWVGGAVWLEDSGDVLIEETVFEANDGWLSGSAVTDQVGGSLTITDCEFLQNVGAPPVKAEDITTFTLTGSTFEGLGLTGEPHFKQQGEYAGGGVHIDGVDAVTIDDCDFANLQAQSGGAVMVEDGYVAGDMVVTLTNSRFSGNRGDNAGGAAYFSQGKTIEIADCDFRFNHDRYAAGGALHVGYFDDVAIRRSNFHSNATDIDSGAAHLVHNERVVIEDSDFSNNGSSIVGGALVIDYGRDSQTIQSVTIDGCTFNRNQTATTGGAVKVDFAGLVTVRDSMFAYNGCRTTCLGGGLFVDNTDTLVVERSAFVRNWAGDHLGAPYWWVGAGITAEASAVTVSDSVFDLNQIPELNPTLFDPGFGFRFGGAIVFRPLGPTVTGDPASLSVRGSTFVQNQAEKASAIAIDRTFVGDGAEVDVEVVNAIVRANYPDVIEHFDTSWYPHPAGVDLTYSDVQGIDDPENHVVDVNPEFQSANESDPYRQWRLQETSPVIGAGIWLPGSVDFEGTPRMNPPSLGAFEFLP